MTMSRLVTAATQISRRLGARRGPECNSHLSRPVDVLPEIIERKFDVGGHRSPCIDVRSRSKPRLVRDLTVPGAMRRTSAVSLSLSSRR